MSGTRGQIDPSEFKETDAITKAIGFLVVSPVVIYFVRYKAGLPVEIGTAMTVSMFVLGIILGIIGGFIGSYLGKVIQEYIGPVAVYEKSIMAIFMRRIGMKIGPSLTGCAAGALLGSGGLVWLFN